MQASPSWSSASPKAFSKRIKGAPITHLPTHPPTYLRAIEPPWNECLTQFVRFQTNSSRTVEQSNSCLKSETHLLRGRRRALYCTARRYTERNSFVAPFGTGGASSERNRRSLINSRLGCSFQRRGAALPIVETALRTCEARFIIIAEDAVLDVVH